MQYPDQSIRGYLSKLIWICLLLVICFVIGTMIQVGLRWQNMTQLAEPEVLSLTLPTIIATHTQPLIATTATREPSPTSATTRTPPATMTLFPSPRSQASKTAQPSATIVIKYTVQAGDTLSRIAAKFNISLADLLDANPEQNASLLGINDVLIIPPRATPSVRKSTTPANSEPQTYIVRDGDTLLAIASRFNISLPELQAANPNLDPTRLKIGDPIFIPDASEKKE